MIAGLIERIARRLKPVSGDVSIDDAIATLNPRFVLTFGIEPLTGLPDDCAQFAVDRPPSVGGPKPISYESFFARALHSTRLVSARMRPWYFDLAVIGPDYRLSDRRRIVHLLRSTAHRRSAAMLLRRATSVPARSLRSACRGLATGVSGLTYAAIREPKPILLIGDLDRATLRTAADADDPVRCGLIEAASFLGDHRIERVTLSTAPVPIADAPRHPGGTNMPRYSSIAPDDGLPTWPQGGNPRAIARWWGKDLALIAAEIRAASEVGFVAADGMNRALLIDRAGYPLSISFRHEGGYGDDPSRATLQLPPACVHAADGARHPLQDAQAMLSGERLSGTFYLLGWMDPRFGHFLVESLSSAWAADWALDRGMKFLLWRSLKPYQKIALSLLGIPDDRIVVAEAGAIYERLVVAEPALRMMGSVSPLAARTWRRIALAAVGGLDQPAAEPFVYLSRRGVRNRPLSNEAELETLLAARGGRILRPETLRFDEQVGAVRRARAVVGCFGSQLHLSMFQRPGARKLVIGTDQFLGPDEALIAIANESIVDHYVETADRNRSASARNDAWTLDLDRFTPAFDRWLAREDAALPVAIV